LKNYHKITQNKWYFFLKKPSFLKLIIIKEINEKIIISKFNLKNKCQFGEKCKFQHLSIDALNEILNKFEDIKQENVSHKRNLKEKLKMISNLDKDSCDVINIYVKDSDKYLYCSERAT